MNTQTKLPACICNRTRNVQSAFTKLEVRIGVWLGAAAMGLLFVLAPGASLFPVVLLLWSFIPLFFYRLFRGHNTGCASRWALRVIFGTLGKCTMLATILGGSS